MSELPKTAAENVPGKEDEDTILLIDFGNPDPTIELTTSGKGTCDSKSSEEAPKPVWHPVFPLSPRPEVGRDRKQHTSAALVPFASASEAEGHSEDVPFLAFGDSRSHCAAEALAKVAHARTERVCDFGAQKMGEDDRGEDEEDGQQNERGNWVSYRGNGAP